MRSPVLLHDCLAGACVTFCDVRRQGCPEDVVCVSTDFDLGMCLPECATPDDCDGLAFDLCLSFSGGDYCISSLFR